MCLYIYIYVYITEASEVVGLIGCSMEGSRPDLGCYSLSETCSGLQA